MTIRIADIINESIVDGPGLRMTVFAQGCPHDCPGCHNPETHSPDGGYDISNDEILSRAKNNPLLDGLTFSGGEPFMQAEAFANLARAASEAGYDIITFSGYTYDSLLSGANKNNHWSDLLQYTDILIDGPYVESLRTFDMPFRGSKNQRAIDVKASMAQNKTILHEFN